jgi:hypothetical protein
MKNLKMFLSAGVVMLAIAGAFATNASKNAAPPTIVPGYIKEGIHCVQKNSCQLENNGILCTETQTGGSQIFRMTAPDVCTTQLWRAPN